MVDYQQALLGLMAGGQQAAEARASLMETLGGQEGMDPLTRALLSQAATRETVAEDDDDEQETAAERTARRQRALRWLRRRMRAMEADLERLQEQNDRLAAALGACRECWGEDRDCEACRGTGRPGSSLPDGHLFRQLVDPAIRARQAERKRRLARVSGPQATGGTT